MFFLARSAICIGLVVAAASQTGTGGVTAAIDRGARDAVASTGRACLQSSACVSLGARALSAGAEPAIGGVVRAALAPLPVAARHPVAGAASPHRPPPQAAPPG